MQTELQTELQEFLRHWERETDGMLDLLRALPADQYDFRPDTGGRSIGELAWHLAEVDAYVSLGIEQGEFKFDTNKPPHIDRPRTIEALAPAFRVVHDEAVTRVARLQSHDWGREIRYADGELWSIGNLLWRKLLMHAVHHRGQLTLLCRLAGGVPPGLFGRTREETPARRVLTHSRDNA
ncbi:MAG TPA: DinB family protein [Terriglobales bacterium]|nr:DinB family protein [Terriglobales bacterium]